MWSIWVRDKRGKHADRGSTSAHCVMCGRIYCFKSHNSAFGFQTDMVTAPTLQTSLASSHLNKWTGIKSGNYP